MGNRLGYLAIVVRELEVHAAAVYVELASEILLAHGRTLQMPAGKSLAPWRRPVHYMLRRGLLPQSEVGGISLLLLPVECAGSGKKLVDIAARKASVAEIGIELGHIEVHRPAALIGITAVKNLLDILYLLYDMARGMRLYRGRQHAEGFHRLVIAQQIVLHHLHRLKLLQTRLLGDLVLAFVGIVFKMPHVGDIAHIAHLVAQMGKIAVHNVESYRRTGMAQMAVAVHGGTANVHTHKRFVKRLECLFLARQRVINK